MYGARAVHEKGIDDYSDEDVTVIMVWAPMFPGDSEAGAIEASKIMSMHRVYQFWDPNKLSDQYIISKIFPTYLRDLAGSADDDDPLKDQLASYAEEAHMWDFVAFYPAGVEWGDSLPKPEQVIKELGFARPNGEGGGSSTLWVVDSITLPLVRSDWFDLIEMQMKRLMADEEE